jgi:hypothetical protein
VPFIYAAAIASSAIALASAGGIMCVVSIILCAVSGGSIVCTANPYQYKINYRIFVVKIAKYNTKRAKKT